MESIAGLQEPPEVMLGFRSLQKSWMELEPDSRTNIVRTSNAQLNEPPEALNLEGETSYRNLRVAYTCILGLNEPP